MSTFVASSFNNFTYPPPYGGPYNFTAGTPVDLTWDIVSPTVTLLLYQRYGDDFASDVLLSDADNNGSLAWLPVTVSDLPDDYVMHFYILDAANISAQGSNSGNFIIVNTSSSTPASQQSTTVLPSSLSTSTNTPATTTASSSPSTSTTSSSSSPTSSPSPHNDSLAIGLGVGITVPLVLIIAAIATFFIYRRRKRANAPRESQHLGDYALSPRFDDASDNAPAAYSGDEIKAQKVANPNDAEYGNIVHEAPADVPPHEAPSVIPELPGHEARY